jgi:hypothetical protein
MSELDGAGNETAPAEQPPAADASHEPADAQARAIDDHAGDEPGEPLTRDECADHMDQDATEVDAPERIEEADLAAIDAYDEVHEEKEEPLTRDEYTELIDRDTTAEVGTPERIEEADLAAIDAYDTEHAPAEPHADEAGPDETPGETLTEHADRDTRPQEPGDTSDRVDPAGSRETAAERINTLEAKYAASEQRVTDLESENALLRTHFAEMESKFGKSMETVNARLDQIQHEGTDKFPPPEPTKSVQRIHELEPSKGQNAKQPPDRARPSNEAIAVGVAVGTAGLTAVADIMGTVAAADATGIVASALSLAAAAVALSRKRKEAKNADRSQD